MQSRALLLLCAAVAVSGAAHPRQLDAVRHFLQRHQRQAAAPQQPHVVRTFIEPKTQDQPKAQKPLAPQEPTPTPSPYFDCPTQFGLFPDPYDCSYYFQCNEGFAFEQHCQPGLQFNPTTSTCDWPANIHPACQAIPYPTAAGPRPAEQNREQLKIQAAAPPPPHVLRTFIESKTQEQLDQQEPKAQQEPKESKAQKQQQPKEQKPLAPQEPTPTPSPYFDCPTQFGLFPDPYDCSYYFQCNEGFAFEQHCQPGLQFNPTTSTCDWPANIHPACQAIPYPTAAGPRPAEQSREQPKSKAAAPRDPSPYFDCPTEFGLFPDPYDCGSYFQCSYSNAFEEKCLAGLEYNPDSQTCDYPANISPPCQAIPYPSVAPKVAVPVPALAVLRH